MGAGSVPQYSARAPVVSARIEDVVVGQAIVEEAGREEPGLRPVTLRVDPAWQRRGIGTRLLVDAARLAKGMGADEIVLTTRARQPGRAPDGAGRPACGAASSVRTSCSRCGSRWPMVLAAGMRGRIRMAGENLTVRISVTELRPRGGDGRPA